MKKLILLITFFSTFFSNTLIFIIGLYILRKYENIVMFGWSQAIGPIASLILIPILGPIIDRNSKKIILIVGQTLSILVLIVSFFIFPYKNILALFVIIISLKIIDNVNTTTVSSLIISVVNESEVQKIKSLQQILLALINITSPLLGALLFSMIHLKHLIIFESICEFICIMFIIKLKLKDNTYEKYNKSDKIFVMFIDGLKYSTQHKKIIFSIFFASIVNFILCSYLIGLPYIQINILNFNNFEFGITESLFSLGLIGSGIYLSMSKVQKYPLNFSYKIVVILSVITIILGFILVFDFNKKIYIYLFLFFNCVIGICISLASIPVTSWLTINIENSYQGRVFNLLNASSQILLPLGILFYTQMFNHFKYDTVFIISGGFLFLFIIIIKKIFSINLKENNLN